MATVTTGKSDQEVNYEAWSLLQDAMTSKDPNRSPAQHFAELHKMGDYFKTPDGPYVVIGYDGVRHLFRSELFTRQLPNGESPRNPPLMRLTAAESAELERIDEGITPFIVKLDGAAHTRLRGLVQASFMPRHLAAIRDLTKETVNRLLAEIDTRQPIDINASFGAVLAPEIVGALIGLPFEQREHVSKLTGTYMRGNDPGGSFEARRTALIASREQREYVRSVISEVRARPRDDLVSTLVHAAGSVISEMELVRLLQVLYIGGYETTAHMIGNGLAALLQHRDQLAILQDDPSLLKSAIDEMLRYDGPISLTYGYAREGAEMMGKPAEIGQQYVGLIRMANRDPDVFEDPDRFDVRRKSNIMSFGTGAHHCLGINLARMELELTFSEFLRRFPNMRLVDTPLLRTPTFQQQSYQKVMVILEPSL